MYATVRLAVTFLSQFREDARGRYGIAQATKWNTDFVQLFCMKLVGKTERQKGKGRYEYIPEYDSTGFSNTDDVKHNTPQERRGLYLYIRLYRGQDLKSAGSAFVPGVCNFKKYSQTQAIYSHSLKETFIYIKTSCS